MSLLFLFLPPIMFVVLWQGLAKMAHVRFPPLHNKRIALLIAHPDDEAMFFSPTVLALTNPTLRNHLKILCLCSGEVESLRETRKKELRKSANLLGLRSTDYVAVLEDSRFRDGMTLTWNCDDIAMLLSQAFASSEHLERTSAPGSNDSSSGTFDIDVLITFDSNGISSHANHISLYHGALHWLRQVDETGAKIALYSLTTTNIMRKYISVLDAPFSILLAALHGPSIDANHEYADRLLFLSDMSGYRRAQKAMTKGHISQMLWFRWGWIGLSRYMCLNDLIRQHPPLKY